MTFKYSYQVDEEISRLINTKSLLSDWSLIDKESFKVMDEELVRLLNIKKDLIKKEQMGEDQGGLYSKYTVINNRTGDIENGVFVLNPIKDIIARKAIRFYAENTSNTFLSKELIDWMDEFDKFRCISPKRSVCDRVGSPVCCCHCVIRNQCFEESLDRMCNLARFGDVYDVEDCSEQGLL